jgi:hypothetical protein
MMLMQLRCQTRDDQEGDLDNGQGGHEDPGEEATCSSAETDAD